MLKKIRKEGNKIPILLLTTMREAEERLNGLKDAAIIGANSMAGYDLIAWA